MLSHILILAGAVAAGKAPPATAEKPISRAQYSAGLSGRFNAIDADKDGRVTAAELAASTRAQLLDPATPKGQAIAASFAKHDTNKNGQLSLDEYRAAIGTEQVQSASIQQALAKLDSNADRSLSRAEYSAPALAAFDRLDSNRDGKLSRAEATAGQAQRQPPAPPVKAR